MGALTAGTERSTPARKAGHPTHAYAPDRRPSRIYLLIDSSTGPTNHPLGTIFYVGLRSDLPEPVYLREATEPESLPEAEVAARARLGHLNREGVRVIVEVVP